MKILFLAHYFHPHIGGVERHMEELNKKLNAKKLNITIVTEQFNKNLKENEVIDGAEVYRIPYSHEKYKGLIEIWKWLFKNRQLIQEADVVHCHDVFIWYLPFRFLFPFKKVFTTFHGWGGHYPIPFKEIFLTKLANLLSTETIAIGKYIEKYYGIRAGRIFYGAFENSNNKQSLASFAGKKLSPKFKNTIVYLGRLEKDTELLEFLKWLDTHKKYQVDFVGDGNLAEACQKYGRVVGFVDPSPFLERAKICVPVGYLSYIEARAYKCKIITFSSNPLKEDYWRDIQKIKNFPTWEKMADAHIRLYNSKK